MIVFAVGVARYHAEVVRAAVEKQQLRADQAELVARLNQTRIDTLHARLQPHFLFNAMHTLSILLDRDLTAAKEGLRHLSRLFRATLRASGDRTHTLRDELDWIESFVAFERLRFDREIELDIQLADGVSAIMAPSLLLQPLVENALKHGGVSDRPLTLRITGHWVEAQRVHLSVEDNGEGLPDEAFDYGDGLRLVDDRLTLEFGERGHLSLAAREGGGTTASVEFPATPQTVAA